MKSDTRRFLQRSAIAAAIAGISTPASASFFALAEQNASGMGTAFAGGAAIAEDASTVRGTPIGGGAGKNPGEPGFVPSFYYTHPITKEFSVGGGINAPFGLTTEYDSTWAGRYHAVKSEIKAINYTLAAAYKFHHAY